MPARVVPAALGLGLLAGLLSGLLGIGGGFVLVPGLVLAVRRSQHEAHATSLAAILPIAVAGVAGYGTASAVDWRAGALLAAASLPCAVLGAAAMRRVPEARLRMLFGSLLLAIAAWLLIGG